MESNFGSLTELQATIAAMKRFEFGFSWSICQGVLGTSKNMNALTKQSQIKVQLLGFSRAFWPISQSVSADGAHLTAVEMNLPICEPSNCVTRSSSCQTTFFMVKKVPKCQNPRANMKEKSQKCSGWNHNSHWASILTDPLHDNRTADMIPSTAHPGPPACSFSKASKFIPDPRNCNPSKQSHYYMTFISSNYYLHS